MWRLKTPDEHARDAPPISVNEWRGQGADGSYMPALEAHMSASWRTALTAERKGDSAPMEMIKAAYKASLKEVHEKNSASGPHSKNDLRRLGFTFTGSRAMRPLPRFAVEQDDKIRPIDDGRFSKSNLPYITPEVLWLMPPNYTGAVAHRFYEAHTRRGEVCPRIFQFKRDESNAYRNSPTLEPELNIAACLDYRGTLVFFCLLGLAFGLAGSVTGYSIKSTVFCVMANDLLMIPVAPYIDDLTAAETELSKGPHHRLDNGESRPNPGSGAR
jgi:hypothetical protein